MKHVMAAAAAIVLATGLGLALAADEKAPTTAPAAAGKVVNTTCPIMGGKVDPATVPAELTREFKGQKVGFCCGMCPPKWDKLSDADKAAKLAAVMAPAPKSKNQLTPEKGMGCCN